MFLRMVTCAPAAGGGPASALRTLASGNAPSVASEPATRPDLRRNVRRSRPPSDWPRSAAASAPRRASRSVRLISTGASSARISVDPIESLHVFGFLVTGLALFVGRLGVGARRAGEWP